MRFGILGATTAWRADGTRVPLGGPTPRALLALLLARAGQVVSADFLIDSVYGERPPADATHALQSQISRLRRSFTIELLPGGYRLDVDPSSVDAHVFLRTADEGRAALEAGAPARAAELLREALALWRGPAAAEAVRLEERRLSALEDLFEAELRTGARDLAAALRAEIERHPLRERLRGQLMRALHAEGRQAEALVAYEETRRVLAEQAGRRPLGRADRHPPEPAARGQAFGAARAADRPRRQGAGRPARMARPPGCRARQPHGRASMGRHHAQDSPTRDGDPMDLVAEAFEGVGWEAPELLKRMRSADDLYYDAISQVRMERWSRGDVVLLGDAAWCPSPLSGMGTGLAVVGAYVLAGELAQGPDGALDRYEQAMRDYVRGCQKSGESAGRWMVPESRFMAWFLNQNYRLLPYLPWKGLIAKSVRKTAGAVSLKDY
ncbi:BTAD domain-containing putative transcriptional regulator [Nonomuraea recticatena]